MDWSSQRRGGCFSWQLRAMNIRRSATEAIALHDLGMDEFAGI